MRSLNNGVAGEWGRWVPNLVLQQVVWPSDVELHSPYKLSSVPSSADLTVDSASEFPTALQAAALPFVCVTHQRRPSAPA